MGPVFLAVVTFEHVLCLELLPEAFSSLAHAKHLPYELGNLLAAHRDRRLQVHIDQAWLRVVLLPRADESGHDLVPLQD